MRYRVSIPPNEPHAGNPAIASWFHGRSPWRGVADPERSASSAVNTQSQHKTNRSKLSVLILSIIVSTLLVPVAASNVTFANNNKSGKPALVKLVGPTASSVSVENSTEQSVSVAPGHYFVKVRYSAPGAYSYSKGDEFDVTETATTAADITITLQKVAVGNYGSKTISEAEFSPDEPATDADGSAEKQKPTALAGSDTKGDVVYWQNGSIWRDITIKKLEISSMGVPRLEIANVPSGFRNGVFTNFISAILRGESVPPPITNSVSVARLAPAIGAEPLFSPLPCLRREYEDALISKVPIDYNENAKFKPSFTGVTTSGEKLF